MRPLPCLAAVAILTSLCPLTLAQGVGTTSQPAPAKLPFTISKATTAITGPLRPDGTVDYLAALNEKYGKGVTPENNGFVLWLQVVGTGDNIIAPKWKGETLRLCGAKETPAGAEVLGKYEDYLANTKMLSGEALTWAMEGLVEAHLALWTAAERPVLAAYLKLHEKQLDLAMRVGERSRWWIPSVSEDGQTLIKALLPSLWLLREGGNDLNARALLRAQAGDWEGCWKDIGAAKALARKVGGGATLVERLVGIAMDANASNALGAIAASGILTESQCKRAMEGLEKLPPQPSIAETWDCGERWSILNSIAVVATGQGALLTVSMDERPGAKTLAVIFAAIEREAVDWDAVMKLANGLYDEQLRALQKPRLGEMLTEYRAVEKRVESWRTTAKTKNGMLDFSKGAGETREAYSERVGKGMVEVVMPSCWKAEVLSRRSIQKTQMVQVVLAAAQVKAKTGVWPKTQEELVPGVLKELPKDMYSAHESAPFRYLMTDHGPRVYSIGENGIDDGGDTKKDDLAVGAK